MSALLSMMMGSGGGVEFKTRIYSQNNAYIILNIYANGIRVKGSVKTIKYGPIAHTIVGYRYSDNSQYTIANLSYGYNSKTCNLSIGSQNNIQNTQLINSAGEIIQENFDVTRKNLVGWTNWGILAQNYYGNYDNFFNDVGRIELITLFQNNNEVVNLVPAIVNGESGMYDTIGQKFYGNANSVGSLVCE